MKDRGIEFEDDSKAISILNNIAYYRLSGYTWCLRKNGQLPIGIRFNQIYDIYCFDKEFRQLLLGILEEVEITFRSRMVNYLSLKYGPIGYREINNFNVFDKDGLIKQDVVQKHTKLVEKIDNEIVRSKEQYIQHYKERYEAFPLWVAAETMSFGTISRMYGLLKKKDAEEIALGYGLKSKFLKSWMQHLAYIRNVCAHYGRLYGKTVRTKPFIPALMKRKGYDSGTILATLDIIKSISKDNDEWIKFEKSLGMLIEDYEGRVDLSQLGFVENWQEILGSAYKV